MEYLDKDCVLEFNPDTLVAVRTVYRLDKSKEMREAIDVLEDWVKKQDHFVKKDFSRDFLERTLIMAAKGSVERAKSRLDKLCTFRTIMPHFFGNYDIRNDFKILDVFSYIISPKLTKQHERVFLIRCTSSKHLSAAMILDGFRFCAMIHEYLRAHDYAISQMVLIDLMDANITDILANLNINDLRQITALMTEGYGLRIKGIHMFTKSKLINTLVTLMKQVLSAKLGGRIHIHSSMESIYEFIPKDILPMEYGGIERSVDEIQDKWVDILNSDDFRKYRKDMSRACTDETRRQTETFNEQYIGMPGTFRTLSVD